MVHRAVLMVAIVIPLAVPASASALTQGQWPGSAGPRAANSYYGYPYPNAPDCNEASGANCVADRWSFYQGQCTSWVAYELNHLNAIPFSNSYRGRHWGNASGWRAAATAAGFAVNGTPAVGSVAWYAASASSADGHVAYVEQVNSPTSIVISEMNYDLHNGFWVHTITTRSGWPTAFLHIADRTTWPPADGTFVSATDTGRVYVIAGGAPLYISNWADVGGPQPTIGATQAQIDALPSVPRDGTYIAAEPSGRVFTVAGGAPLYVANWSDVGGPHPTVTVDDWDIANAGVNAQAHLNPRPANGTYVSAQPSGRVFTIAGGAPMYVSSWSDIGGARPTTVIDDWDIANAGVNGAAHLSAVPADGTIVSTHPSGRVYVVDQGGAVYVPTWSDIGGPQPATTIDDWDIANAGDNATDHLQPSPAPRTPAGALNQFYNAGLTGTPNEDNWATTGSPAGGYGFSQTLAFLLSASGANRIALEGCLVTGTNDHFVSTNAGCEGQTTLRTEGWLYRSQPTSGLPTTPLYRCVISATGDHFVWTDPGCVGFAVEGLLGYAPRTQRSLNRYDNPYAGGVGDHWVTTGAVANGAYHFEQTLGYVLARGGTNRKPLNDCVVTGGTDHFLSTAAGCEGQSVVELDGYLYVKQPATPATAPLYRCLVTATGEHFASTHANCEGQTTEGLLGYIRTS